MVFSQPSCSFFFLICCKFVVNVAYLSTWCQFVNTAALYLGGSVGVDGDHVLHPLLDFQLDVELPLQGCDAFFVSRRSALGPRRLRTFICQKTRSCRSDWIITEFRNRLLCRLHHFRLKSVTLEMLQGNYQWKFQTLKTVFLYTVVLNYKKTQMSQSVTDKKVQKKKHWEIILSRKETMKQKDFSLKIKKNSCVKLL